MTLDRTGQWPHPYDVAFDLDQLSDRAGRTLADDDPGALTNELLIACLVDEGSRQP